MPFQERTKKEVGERVSPPKRGKMFNVGERKLGEVLLVQ